MLLMRVLYGLPLAALFLLFGSAGLRAAQPSMLDPWRLCPQAITAAERTQAIPKHLLSAIALAETGRKHPTLGKRMPWPWTVMAEGQGRYLATKQEAIAEVRELQSRGIRNIDVGCMQVNLYYHPEAFFSMEQASIRRPTSPMLADSCARSSPTAARGTRLPAAITRPRQV